MDNINKLLSAYLITENVFKERGYRAGLVDLTQYLRSGNANVFTSTNGARNLVADINLSELNEDVMRALIDACIIKLSSDNSYINSKTNGIEDVIKEWSLSCINGGNRQTFEQLYMQIISKPENNVNIVNCLNSAQRQELVRENFENNYLTPAVIQVIEFLEKQKNAFESKDSLKKGSK